MIRKIIKSDYESIEILLQQSSSNIIDFDSDQLIKDLDRISDLEHIEIFGYEEDDKIVGMCTVGRVDGISEHGRPFAVIENILVERSKRSKGIGKKLINHAIKITEQWNCYKVILETGSKKEWKLAFYEKCGFIRGEKTAFIKRFE
jgi:GNAT superfamily N-acetyltransferase